MKQWGLFVIGAITYLLGFFAYIWLKIEHDALVVFAIAGTGLMISSLTSLYFSGSDKVARADFDAMLRYFVLIACLIIAHALTDYVFDWDISQPDNQPTRSEPYSQSELW
ncbi:MAG: hypothetical protein ACOYUZ_04240 [Patescibacteria group bacterium]